MCWKKIIHHISHPVFAKRHVQLLIAKFRAGSTKVLGKRPKPKRQPVMAWFNGW